MIKKFQITYHPVNSLELKELTYVIIGALENDKWIFVRHRDRLSWELPAGHIEKNESALDAAERELFEETGTLSSSMQAIQDYTVQFNGEVKSGRIFFARVRDRQDLPVSEIEEIKIQKISPQPVTYPEAHNSFLRLLNEFVGQ